MRLSTILDLVLAVDLAAANPFALLNKRDSTTTSMTSTTSTDLPATPPVSLTSTLTPALELTPFPATSTELLTVTPTATTDPAELTPGLSEPDPNGLGPGSDTVDRAEKACYPRSATGTIDFNAPCNQLQAIFDQCSYGPRVLQVLSLPQEGDWPKFRYWQRQSPETERVCVCQSQITDVIPGCAACLRAHEYPGLGDLLEESYPQTMFQQHCDVGSTVEQSFDEFVNEASEEWEPSEDPRFDSVYIGETLGTSTDVSFYYTLSVTRSDAYDIAVPTPILDGDATYTTTRISDGLIIPTSQAEKEAGEQDPGKAGTSSISTSTSGISSFDDRFTTSSASRVSRTRSLNMATPSASQSSSDYEGSVEQAMNGCFPRNATGNLDFSAPCNRLVAIRSQCAYGSQELERLIGTFESLSYPGDDPDMPKLSPEAERTCICQSQCTDAHTGCFACMKAHQLLLMKQNFEASIHAAMEQYCDVDYKATQSFEEFSLDFAIDYFSEHQAPDDYYTAEVISTSTDVSLYYTMSVTRSDAYDIAVPTPSGHKVVYTSTRTSDGQIVPTAPAVKDPDSPTTDSGAAAMSARAAGMVAMAALAALGL